MRIGDEVRTGIPLPGIPEGTIGRVLEIGSLFVVVQFEDGRLGYYSAPQVRVVANAARVPVPGSGNGVELGFDDAHVPRGSHLCLLPASREEMIDAVAWYLLAGLRAGEDCVCVIPLAWARPVRKALLKAAGPANGILRRGGVEIVNNRDVYGDGTGFTAAGQLERTGKYLGRIAGHPEDGARYLGYPGDDVVRHQEWWNYEDRVTRVLREAGVTALCVYDPLGPDSIVWRRAEAVHPYVARAGKLSAGRAASV
jgi:hypothetical protein